MIPRHLRAKAGVSISDLAQRLRIKPGDLRTLEETNIVLWEVTTLRAYLVALGYELRVVAVKDGSEEPIA